jgi:uroporphyrinogen decarboxylase
MSQQELAAEGREQFGGLRVAAFESRRAAEMARLIERFGGRPHVSPALREVPLDHNREAVDFAHRLITGEVGVVIFLTGVGFKYLLDVVDKHIPRQRYLDALADIVTIARGPKPTAAMKELGLTPTHRVPAPNTWREILTTIDESVPIAQQTVGLQEYGQTNSSLIAGLEARGAHVIRVAVYRWALPEDCRPLEQNIRDIVAGRIDVVLFTSAHQVVNLFQAAESLDLREPLRAALPRCVVASIGPTTSEMLRDYDVPVDIEPAQGKMGQLVAAAAAESPSLRSQKSRRVTHLDTAGTPAPQTAAPWRDSLFMKACRREATDVTPVWLMRQAGRYMHEYRQVRAQTTFLELCKNPQLCSEVMCTAVRRLGVDAAIVFSDLLPILEPMGLDLEFSAGEGPVIHNPIREPEQVDQLRELESMQALDFVCQAVRQTRADLPSHIPLIGFAGAPFTLASYAIEGGGSRTYTHTKSLMYRDEGAWRELMSRLARAVSLYLNAQIRSGAQCVQLFDSWVGCLGPEDYRRFVLPFVQQIVDSLPADVPLINFGTGNPALIPLLAESGAAVIGLDWRVRLADGWLGVGHDRAVQGNLDPAVLLAEPPEIRRRAADILQQAAGRPGHIFNLGHGVLQQTPVEHAVALVDAVHELSLRR